MDNGAEKLFLVDEGGRIITSQEALLLIGLLCLHEGNQEVIAYPIFGTSILEQMATKRGNVVLRTPINPRYLLEHARKPNVSFVGDAEGGFIFPKFQPAFDAMFAVARILQMLAEHDTTLGKLWSQIKMPEVNVLHRRVPCPWGKKGQVMRLAQSVGDSGRIELIDGVKIHLPEGWVIVLPDGSEAFCHLWAEARTESTARKYLEEYTRHVEEWQKAADPSSLSTDEAGEAIKPEHTSENA